MTDLQRDHYEGADKIGSDPWGVLDRDNRNHQQKLEHILDATAAEPGDRVLEVGCGHGIHASAYAERFAYTGIDISDSLVAATRSRTPDDAVVLQGDATDLSFADDAVDAVVGTAILHHLADQRGALAEWARVTRPGGSITLMEPNALFPKDFVTAYTVAAERHKRHMTPWRLRGTLKSIGRPYDVRPAIYTPPWPAALHGLYDRVDDLGQLTPGLRWLSQMLRIHVQC